MSRFENDRIRGSLWTKGRTGTVIGAAIILVLIIRVPVIRWFLGISVVIGVVMAAAIHWYFEHKPITSPDEDKIVLHLNDDEPPRK